MCSTSKVDGDNMRQTCIAGFCWLKVLFHAWEFELPARLCEVLHHRSLGESKKRSVNVSGRIDEMRLGQSVLLEHVLAGADRAR